ncbi:MAG: hypothetical protein CMK74_03795 [Pseudomonadales bacterium]|nr:hypothetical protein [Pseudomonadales bacterium]
MSAYSGADLRLTCHLLLGQVFICPMTYPELFQLLREDDFAREVSQVLNPLGYSLSQVGDSESPEVFFCALLDVEDSRQRQHAEKRLLEIRDQIGAFIEFFRLVDNAGQSSVVSGGEVSFSRLLAAIENHPPYLDQLRDLQGLKLFESSRNAKDHADRLSRVLKVMQDQGYIVRRSTDSTVYAFTGKMAYLQRIMGWLADHHQIEVIKPEDRSAFQEGLL